MTKLKRDELRVIVCFAGIFGLFFQLLAQTFLGAEVGQGLTGSFVTLVTLAIADSAWEKFTGKRGPSDPGDPPTSTEDASSSPSQHQRKDLSTERSEFESLAVVV